MTTAAGGVADSEPFQLPARQNEVGPINLVPLVPYVRSQASVQHAAWPVVLLPDLLFGRDAMPSDCVEIHQRVEWTRPVPSGTFTATISPTWIVCRTDGSEFELRTAALDGDGEIASSTIVCRTGETLAESGRPVTYRVPDLGDLSQTKLLTITESDIDEFCEYSQAHYAVSSTVGGARRLGFHNMLVPGPLLALHHAAAAGSRDRGSMEIWFRGPVTAGSAMSIWHSRTDSRAWCIRAVGGAKPATIAVVS